MSNGDEKGQRPSIFSLQNHVHLTIWQAYRVGQGCTHHGLGALIMVALAIL